MKPKAVGSERCFHYRGISSPVQTPGWDTGTCGGPGKGLLAMLLMIRHVFRKTSVESMSSGSS